MTSRRKTEPNGTPKAAAAFADMFQAPTANSLIVSQRLALEAARFWARRMRAYADQMETLASCRSTDDFAQAQTRFLERMRDDYAAESEAIGELLNPETLAPHPSRNGGVEADA